MTPYRQGQPIQEARSRFTLRGAGWIALVVGGVSCMLDLFGFAMGFLAMMGPRGEALLHRAHQSLVVALLTGEVGALAAVLGLRGVPGARSRNVAQVGGLLSAAGAMFALLILVAALSLSAQ